MKKYAFIIVFLISSLAPNMTYALEGIGTVDEIKICAVESVGSWRNFMFFRLSDQKWFGIYGNDVGTQNQDDTPSQSLVLLAYANRDTVKIKATYDTTVRCGVTAVMFWNRTDDYLTISKD